MTSETSVDRATQLQELTEQAQTACATTGAASSECVDAWSAVEALQSESFNSQTDRRSSLDRYCADSPDAAECRIYDV
ncbi:MAG: Calvin cycle protein CP12 [Phormidesmis sp. CAN_BIN44]|nr:Calvin cycle protein CP12 [Phormidesmis sp. CAN_BIN44]